MNINRIWAMPNKRTFTIKPIEAIIKRHICNKQIIVDPFANESILGTLTNDINKDMATTTNQDALVFLQSIPVNYTDVVLYDPPYSFSQATICYKKHGRENFQVTRMQYWAQCKDRCAEILKLGGIAICCGWNSMGLGKGRGFKMEEILLVPHGGSKNDTIVTIEIKGKETK